MNVRQNGLTKITYMPFYGGAKGQILEITETDDGVVKTQIIISNQTVETPQTIESIDETAIPKESLFTKNIKTIQKTTQAIIKLQDAAKKHGKLSDEEQELYNQNMEQLNLSTKTLANIQQEDDDEDLEGISRTNNLKFWFENKKDKFRQSEENKEEEKPASEENENEPGDDDGVAINLPPDDASVAEAKPVGLAVAGPGGVAASKPIATAVVGPAGLAIARPVATAIAGVSPDDPMLPIYADGFIKLPDKKKDPSNNNNNKEICNQGHQPDKNKNKKEEKPKMSDFLRFALKQFNTQEDEK